MIYLRLAFFYSLSMLSPITYATILICDFQFSSGCLFETHALFRVCVFSLSRMEVGKTSRGMNYMDLDMVELKC